MGVEVWVLRELAWVRAFGSRPSGRGGMLSGCVPDGSDQPSRSLAAAFFCLVMLIFELFLSLNSGLQEKLSSIPVLRGKVVARKQSYV